MKTLRLILGDQLNEQHSWFNKKDEEVTYVLMEVKSETDYVVHHIQKVVGIFYAMRQFAEKLRNYGHQIVYISLNDPINKHSFTENIKELIQKEQFEKFEYLLPDEWRVDEVLVQLLSECEVKTIGEINTTSFNWPINRIESLELLDYFIENCLPLFGTLQDAMTIKSWSIYHARISFSLNIKLISPKEVIDKVVSFWNEKQHCTVNQIEGFVRQILGWREYMRGIYWAKMPEYKTLNFFEQNKKLPSWFWNGNTKMNCLHHAISQSLKHAYAHHIQRLMITGNFALLAGINPDDVDNWYLGIYIDAFEWVEITNTRGMSQYADGGIVGSKPYISSASYIDKMSDYCKNCHYKSNEKTGENACPFNSLYWNFFDQHQDKLRSNFRLKMMYSIWDKMDSGQKEKLLVQASHYLNNIENL